MFIILGYLIVFFSVFGSYVALGGSLGALYQPFELLLIGGAALGGYFAASNGRSISMLFKAIKGALKSSPYNKALYMELMSLLFALLTKARRDGMMAIEADIEDPKQSAIFTAYPAILRDNLLIEFICDYLRIMISGNMSAFEIEALMDQEIDSFQDERSIPSNALHVVADGLPAFGIVAAVLGVIKALASVDQPPAVLADLISKAMVGTFLGILLAYGFVSPLANVMDSRNAAAVKVLECIKVTLLANLNGYPPPVSVEFGRKVLFSSDRPSFIELEEHVRQSRASANK
ncbi:MAG TPA: flagellar motor stator protein MotA [Paenalcaligenes hominis]|uniref:Chemotaxis protein MotA n=1 Tax=Paenalcaligenes hominis TaxID=643674 RepID=A0A9D2VGQ9_9BURK|nr:flagellar motor stator protein MotA [Paenalcaligenes hominis]NJB65990.1 chemotaxis protein MotA [Paenalcaligenes hominis]HJH24595.1 flagellar motor stator protein MotA [Paenalcaligenes hominis]